MRNKLIPFVRALTRIACWTRVSRRGGRPRESIHRRLERRLPVEGRHRPGPRRWRPAGWCPTRTVPPRQEPVREIVVNSSRIIKLFFLRRRAITREHPPRSLLLAPWGKILYAIMNSNFAKKGKKSFRPAECWYAYYTVLSACVRYGFSFWLKEEAFSFVSGPLSRREGDSSFCQPSARPLPSQIPIWGRPGEGPFKEGGKKLAHSFEARFIMEENGGQRINGSAL